MVWLGIFLCIGISMLFSGLESAILSVSLVRIRFRAKEKESAAIKLLKLFEHRERVLISILLLNTLSNLLAFAALTTMMGRWAGNWGYVIAFFGALPVYLLFIELLPKSIFKMYPYRMLETFLPVLRAAFYSVAPVIWLGAQVVELFRSSESRQARGERSPGDGKLNEFRIIAAISEEQGELGEMEAAMIHSVLDFRSCTVKDVMLPIANVTSVPANMPIGQVLEIARKTDFSHFPVMDEGGDLIGILNVYEALREGNRQRPAYSIIRRLVRTTTDDSGTVAIRTLRASGVRIAAVHAAEGRLVGIVTLHDLVQRLVKAGNRAA